MEYTKKELKAQKKAFKKAKRKESGGTIEDILKAKRDSMSKNNT